MILIKKKRVEIIHSKISNEAMPKVGLEFDIEEAYDFYTAYAYKIGFSIRKHKSYKAKRRDGRMAA